MKYRIDTRYVWYNNGSQIVLMYFINHVPFTFDELPDETMYDLEVIKIADNERKLPTKLINAKSSIFRTLPKYAL